MNLTSGSKHDNERGIALITALMVTTMLLALGMAVVMTATTDTSINRSHRLGEQAFFAADGGLAVARSALATAIQEELARIQTEGVGEFANPDTFQVIPDPNADGASELPFYVNIRARALELTESTARNARLNTLNGASFEVTTIELTGGTVNPVALPFVSGSGETATLRYTIVVEGETESGARASVTETARITTGTVLTRDEGEAPVPRSFKFSGFGAFFDVGDQGGTNALASGTFSGPAHSNTRFSFNKSSNVIFTSTVSQYEDQIRISTTGALEARPTADQSWIDISASGYEQKPKVPLPENNFSQEYAVINGTGIIDTNSDGTPIDAPAVSVPTVFDSTGRVTKEALQANLRGVASTASAGTNSNAAPQYVTAGGTLTSIAASGVSLAPGVYIAANSTTITGAGIYVQGDANDIQLVPGTLATDQKFIITQGSVTTTITVSPTNNTTTVKRGTDSIRTYTGVPTDKSDPANPTGGTCLFVKGSIKSLRGGVDGSTVKPAIATDYALTITAERDITVTGDLKYSNIVADPTTGVPVTNANTIKNVLGLFTNDGNVNMEPNGTYVASTTLSLQMDAAVVSFNSKTTNDTGRKQSNGGTSGTIDGSIVFTGTTSALASNDKWTLIGSRVQANINNIGFPKRNIFFDTRFDGGKFAPPFWPGTDYTLGEAGEDEGVVGIATITTPTPSGVSWYRKSR